VVLNSRIFKDVLVNTLIDKFLCWVLKSRVDPSKPIRSKPCGKILSYEYTSFEFGTRRIEVDSNRTKLSAFLLLGRNRSKPCGKILSYEYTSFEFGTRRIEVDSNRTKLSAFLLLGRNRSKPCGKIFSYEYTSFEFGTRRIEVDSNRTKLSAFLLLGVLISR
jgi:DNA-directed RNA polymerase subunit N (RpoN/RPB10)